MEVNRKVVELALDDVLPNRFQPRIKFAEDSLNELSESIKEHGVIQPIVVRPVGNKYEIIAGERRYKASVQAGKTTIPAIITDLNDKDSAEVALIENVQRQNLTPIEEAISYKKILDMGYLTQTTLADKLGKNQSTIANKLRLLELDDEVQEALLNSEISERHARSLLRISDKTAQVAMLNRIIKERMTVRKTDEEIDKVLNGVNNDINNGINNNGLNNDFATDTVQTPIPDVSNQPGMVTPNIPEPVSFESLFSENPGSSTEQVVNPINPVEQAPIMNENSIENPQPIESIDFGPQINPGFVNVDKVMEDAQPINPTIEPVNMNNFMPQFEENSVPTIDPNPQIVEPVIEQEQPRKFFNMLNQTVEQTTGPVQQQTETNVFNFDNLFEEVPTPQPVSTPEVSVIPQEQPAMPVVDSFTQVPTQPVESLESMQQVTVPNPMPEEASPNTFTTNSRFDSAIQVINECAAKLEQLGYKQEHDNFDLDDMYQVIFRIEQQ